MLERMYRKTLIRSGVSLVFFVIFAIITVVNVFAPNEFLRMVVIVPVIVSLMVLPRAVYPKSEPQNPTEKTYHERLMRMGIWLTYTRAIYFVVAIALLFGLPRLVQ